MPVLVPAIEGSPKKKFIQHSKTSLTQRAPTTH